MRSITVTEAARGFSDLISRVRYGGESALLTKGGKPVARIVPVRRPRTGRELADAWAGLPHLDLAAAAAFERDLSDARRSLPPVKSRWD
jgi:prevent-host-death family protein